jgi:hypothetical protein
MILATRTEVDFVVAEKCVSADLLLELVRQRVDCNFVSKSGLQGLDERKNHDDNHHHVHYQYNTWSIAGRGAPLIAACRVKAASATPFSLFSEPEMGKGAGWPELPLSTLPSASNRGGKSGAMIAAPPPSRSLIPLLEDDSPPVPRTATLRPRDPPRPLPPPPAVSGEAAHSDKSREFRSKISRGG